MKSQLNQYINDHCIYRCDPDKKYSPQLANGRMPYKNIIPNDGVVYQFYLPRLVSDAEHFSLVIEALTIALLGAQATAKKPIDDFQLFGPETASAPYLAAIQQYYYHAWDKKINICTVRRKRKGSGLYNFVNGKPNDKPVIVFDDLFTSGYSMHRVMTFCQDQLDLELSDKCLSVVALHTEEDAMAFRFRPKEDQEITPMFCFSKDDFDFKYSKEKYWSPIDALY